MLQCSALNTWVAGWASCASRSRVRKSLASCACKPRTRQSGPTNPREKACTCTSSPSQMAGKGMGSRVHCLDLPRTKRGLEGARGCGWIASTVPRCAPCTNGSGFDTATCAKWVRARLADTNGGFEARVCETPSVSTNGSNSALEAFCLGRTTPAHLGRHPQTSRKHRRGGVHQAARDRPCARDAGEHAEHLQQRFEVKFAGSSHNHFLCNLRCCAIASADSAADAPKSSTLPPNSPASANAHAPRIANAAVARALFMRANLRPCAEIGVNTLERNLGSRAFMMPLLDSGSHGSRFQKFDAGF